MCGIAGYFSPRAHWNAERMAAVARAMTDAIAHRGPDDQGRWCDPAQGIALAQRRLSIVDLSPLGHQPMFSASERYAIVFNGEIYNFLELRAELEGQGAAFRSHSDTEVMLEAMARWGVVATCERLQGMFAFALWDREQQRLWLGRDRIGKKPLYVYRSAAGELAFGSELKALWAYPGFQPTLNPAAVAEYLRFSYVPDHLCIFTEVQKVLPGTVQEIGPDLQTRSHTYWSLAAVARAGEQNRITDLAEAEATLLPLLQDATRRRMVADVPLGAFLSGGVDSGLVVSLMQEASTNKVRTFSIGFPTSGFDEAPVARAVAAHLGTDHTELYVSDAEAQQVVPLMPDLFDEPFADSSQIPTYILAKLTRAEVTVAMTGDGGDEAFGGYLRYRNAHGVVGQLYGLPKPLRHAFASAVESIPAGAWSAMVAPLPARRRPRFIASKVSKVARAMRLDSADERGQAYLSFWEPARIMQRPASPVQLLQPADYRPRDSSEAMQYWETLHYLSGDLMTKADRATMAASLEARSPLLDYRVVELAWRLPPAMKASPQATKLILRNLLHRYVPAAIVDLPKQGFSVPIGDWMRHGLRDWVEATLAYGRRATAELLNWDEVDQAWTSHLAGQIGYAEKMWIVIMFCAWHQRWMGQATVAIKKQAAMH